MFAKIHKLPIVGKTAMWLMITCLCSSCSDRFDDLKGTDGRVPLTISGNIAQENITRADISGFADGDCMGVFVVDYEGDAPCIKKFR